MHRAWPSWMAFWIKTGLWVAAIVLPGGLLLLPVIYAMHRHEARREDAAAPIPSRP
ncbi:MAG: hypothetical protein KF729_01115 [Sandaracinaceae bacterium]|nr:hypothetical protein [Sandaracinaceae bacterium]